MNKTELFRRYLLFVFSVLVNALSIAVITKAMLGTSPISSVPYVLSVITPMTMGGYTVCMNLLFILFEMALMKRKEVSEKRYELMSQVPISICFGLFIDVSMRHIIWWLLPSTYFEQILTLLAGCFLLGAGISLEVKANVAMVTGEYIVQIISRAVRRDFGLVKVCFDVTLVTIACVLSWAFLGRIEGVREGTVAAALLVGPISHLVYPLWRIFDRWLNIRPSAAAAAPESRPTVVTITREYCSGGHVIGEMLAKKLGVRYYDRDIISLAAKESRLPEDFVSENEQRLSSRRLRDIILSDYESPEEKALCRPDAIFVAQSRVIRKAASEGDCIIVGRCADYILADLPPESIVRVFCYTNLDDAFRRSVEEYHSGERTTKEEIARTNRQRVEHYQYYTGRKWGDPHNYDLTINTATTSAAAACDAIARLYEEKRAAKKKAAAS